MRRTHPRSALAQGIARTCQKTHAYCAWKTYRNLHDTETTHETYAQADNTRKAYASRPTTICNQYHATLAYWVGKPEEGPQEILQRDHQVHNLKERQMLVRTHIRNYHIGYDTNLNRVKKLLTLHRQRAGTPNPLMLDAKQTKSWQTRYYDTL